MKVGGLENSLPDERVVYASPWIRFAGDATHTSTASTEIVKVTDKGISKMANRGEETRPQDAHF
jgi:hypothetical protein